MDDQIKACLYDILTSIMEIESFFADQKKDFSRYQSDLRTKRAIERNIEIIGEAMNRILKGSKHCHFKFQKICGSKE